MALNVISLTDMLRSVEEKDIITLLSTFQSLRTQDSQGADDVEFFLHNRALQYEKMDLSRTYLVMSTYRESPILVGYFSIANKPLTIARKNFIRFTNSMKRRLMGVGHKTEQETFVIRGYLVGQLSKNFSEEARSANCCSGDDLLQLTYMKVAEVYRIVGGRVLYLECENVSKIVDFYKRNGFSQLEEYESDNGYCLMVKQLKDIIPS